MLGAVTIYKFGGCRPTNSSGRDCQRSFSSSYLTILHHTISKMVFSSEIPSHLSTSWKATDTSRRLSPRLCSACDSCRQSRVKCTGGSPCQRCGNNGATCHYSVSLRNGRLKANKVQKPSLQPSPPFSGTPSNGHGRGGSRDVSSRDELNINTVSLSQSISNGSLSSCDKDSSSLAGSCFTAGLNHSSLLQVSVCLVAINFRYLANLLLKLPDRFECESEVKQFVGLIAPEPTPGVGYASGHKLGFRQLYR
jgi:hypothetical protein